MVSDTRKISDGPAVRSITAKLLSMIAPIFSSRIGEVAMPSPLSIYPVATLDQSSRQSSGSGEDFGQFLTLIVQPPTDRDRQADENQVHPHEERRTEHRRFTEDRRHRAVHTVKRHD